MRLFNKSLDELLTWGLKLGFVLFIFCIIVPAFLLHAFKTLKEVPTEPWPLALMAVVGGIVGAAFRDGVDMIRNKLRARKTKEVE
jgi:hypothetical protein